MTHDPIGDTIRQEATAELLQAKQTGKYQGEYPLAERIITLLASQGREVASSREDKKAFCERVFDEVGKMPLDKETENLIGMVTDTVVARAREDEKYGMYLIPSQLAQEIYNKLSEKGLAIPFYRIIYITNAKLGLFDPERDSSFMKQAAKAFKENRTLADDIADRVKHACDT